MARARWMVGPLAMALGCAPDLPASPLGDDARLLFRDFDADPGALPAILDRMDAALGDVDLDAAPTKRLSAVPELSSDYFGGATVEDGLDTTRQIRMAMAGSSRHSVAENLAVQAAVNFTCANSDSVVCHERAPADGEDADCFLAGTCDVYRTENTIRVEAPLDFWVHAPVDFRTVTLGDGRAAAVARTWFEQPFDNDNGKRTWQQRFGVDVFIEDPDDAGRTRRYYATWLGPDVSGITGGFLETALRRGLDEGFRNPDDVADAGTCDIDLDACLADSPF